MKEVERYPRAIQTKEKAARGKQTLNERCLLSAQSRHYISALAVRYCKAKVIPPRLRDASRPSCTRAHGGLRLFHSGASPLYPRR